MFTFVYIINQSIIRVYISIVLKYYNMFRNIFFISLLLLLVLSASAHSNGDHHEFDDTTTTQKPNLRSKSLICVKIWCLILVFLGTSIGGVCPYFLNWNEEFLVLGTQFAGGVFLATAMLHFLSEASETFDELTTIEYPFAYMLACGGYLLTMLADCVASYFYGKHSNSDVESQGWFLHFFKCLKLNYLCLSNHHHTIICQFF